MCWSCITYIMHHCWSSFQVKPLLAMWRAEEEIKDRDVSGGGGHVWGWVMSGV